ncbi:hypothetical protein T4E_7474 [Trichinella pseudospiralis]|uniref:Uncharacterized protein n=1 Tax=Trichinella pseudospiralis TaxID=6337 RepID=A0A0V0WRN0_TRIPS|nr:hypothetical protein T4E_7474 [Trichinella pseudospiralis]
MHCQRLGLNQRIFEMDSSFVDFTDRSSVHRELQSSAASPAIPCLKLEHSESVCRFWQNLQTISTTAELKKYRSLLGFSPVTRVSQLLNCTQLFSAAESAL